MYCHVIYIQWQIRPWMFCEQQFPQTDSQDWHLNYFTACVLFLSLFWHNFLFQMLPNNAEVHKQMTSEKMHSFLPGPPGQPGPPGEDPYCLLGLSIFYSQSGSQGSLSQESCGSCHVLPRWIGRCMLLIVGLPLGLTWKLHWIFFFISLSLSLFLCPVPPRSTGGPRTYRPVGNPRPSRTQGIDGACRTVTRPWQHQTGPTWTNGQSLRLYPCALSCCTTVRGL